jgi:hypothetical protein
VDDLNEFARQFRSGELDRRMENVTREWNLGVWMTGARAWQKVRGASESDKSEFLEKAKPFAHLTAEDLERAWELGKT